MLVLLSREVETGFPSATVVSAEPF